MSSYMNFLFIHQNFPGQFKFLAPALVRKGHRVLAMTLQKGVPSIWDGVELIPYSTARGTTPQVHPWVADFETKTIRGEACFRAALKLREKGFSPDVIVAHPGWGESLFLKDVWPRARLGIYCEFFYKSEGLDVGFDPEFPMTDEGDGCRLRLKNLNNLLHFEVADAGISPTHWQASTFPMPFRDRITVIHDGIDTVAVAPDAQATLSLKSTGGKTVTLDHASEVVTFVNRNLEPYRGFHTMMRALPELLLQRPHAHVVIVGGSDVSYGARPPEGQSWRGIYSAEVRSRISDADWSRVHFVGKVPYPQFLRLLQVSSVHVYLTYPFVLSWSLLEAMSAGCAIVASDTQPLREVLQHGDTGLLIDFFSPEQVTESICALLADASQRARLGGRARDFARSHYDLASICLPRQLEWVQALGQF